MGEPSVGVPPIERPLDDRLDSWKEIASYLKRDVTTVQRWEKREGMPVHRHLHDSIGSVYASRVDLDAWMRSRNLRARQENGNHAQSLGPAAQPVGAALGGTSQSEISQSETSVPGTSLQGTSLPRWLVPALAAVAAALAIGAG